MSGPVAQRPNPFARFLDPNTLRVTKLDVDTSSLSPGYQKAIPKLLKVLGIMDRLFLMQDHPQGLEIKESLARAARGGDEYAKQGLEAFNIFNGPIGVTKDGKPTPLFEAVAERLPGGTVYGAGITAEEIEAYVTAHPDLRADFDRIDTIIERKDGGLVAIPYHERYKPQLQEAAALLNSAADDVDSKGLADYLRATADALVTGDYRKRDAAFVMCTDSPIEFMAGPLEVYRDLVQSKKAFFAGLLCMVNHRESERLAAYVGHMQAIENQLPQEKRFAKDMSRTAIPVKVVDVIAMSGDYQAKRPGMAIAQTLPNDEDVLARIGRKVLVFKNFFGGFAPTEDVLYNLVGQEHRKYATVNSMVNLSSCHEFAHSHGPKETVKKDAQGRPVLVKHALGKYEGIIEELKADLGAVYNMRYLVKHGIYTGEEGDEVVLEGCLLGNLLKMRPTLEHTHYMGRLMKLNYFMHFGAVTLTEGKFYLDFAAGEEATRQMLAEVLAIQSSGDQEQARLFIERWSAWGSAAKYACEMMQRYNPRFYNQVSQPEFDAGSPALESAKRA